jgi:hypothetical protein
VSLPRASKSCAVDDSWRHGVATLEWQRQYHLGTCTPSACATAMHSATTSRITSLHTRAVHGFHRSYDSRHGVVGAVQNQFTHNAPRTLAEISVALAAMKALAVAPLADDHQLPGRCLTAWVSPFQWRHTPLPQQRPGLRSTSGKLSALSTPFAASTRARVSGQAGA